MSSSSSSKPSSSYDAFSQVDKLVSKPVLGSDGAASWQEFQSSDKSKQSYYQNRQSSAPRAPLKKADKLGTGFSTWEAERDHESQVRKESGHANVGDGYTTFKKKNSSEEAALRKKNKQIEARIRPDDKEYYIPCKTFEGWKFDYVFTTRPPSYGTGYFWDGMDSIKKLRGELPSSESSQLPSSSSSSSALEATAIITTTDNTDDGEVVKPKKKKRKKAVAGPTIIEDPNNPMEQVAAAIRKKQAERLNASGHPSLPPGWEMAVDPSTGKSYYFCRATGERRWEAPDSTSSTTSTSATDNNSTSTSALQPSSSSLSPESGLPYGWMSAVDPTTGKTYYYKADGTGERTWEKPTGEDTTKECTSSSSSTTPAATTTTNTGDDDNNIVLPSDWKSAVDSGSGKVYYYRPSTGETKWEVPSS